MSLCIFSGSEKENESGNKSDIRKHGFIIEKEVKKPVMEDSIHQMICNVSMLKFPTSLGDPKSSFTSNRLTENLSSPCLPRSPLCSTPFSKKLRGKSIYSKFSPILSKDTKHGKRISLPKDNIVEVLENLEEGIKTIENRSEIDKKANTSKLNSPKDLVEENNRSNKALPEEVNAIQNLSKTSQINSPNNSSISTSFYGFPNDCMNNTPTEFIVSPVLKSTNRKSLILASPMTGSARKAKSYHTNKTSSNSSIFCDNTHSIENDKSSQNNDLVELSVEQEPFLGFSEKTIAESNKDTPNIEIILNKSENEDGISVKSNDDSFIEETIIEGELALSVAKTDTSDNLINETGNSSNEEYNSFTSANESVQSSKASMYDTICESSDEDTHYIAIAQPVVKLTRLDKDLFDQYWKPAVTNDESLNTSSSSGEAANLDSSRNKEEEPHISFVTTRRRNFVTRESSIHVIDESDNSSNSEGDMTVLGNNLLVNIESPIKTEIQPRNLQNITESDNTSKDDRKIDNSRVTFANASAIQPDDFRPPIVLKPGKKWERSLSIYKRMTILNETDTSLLEEQDMKRKGRKYRESIIDTMELQERGKIHSNSSQF